MKILYGVTLLKKVRKTRFMSVAVINSYKVYTNSHPTAAAKAAPPLKIESTTAAAFTGICISS
jgi:hypothetical protein